MGIFDTLLQAASLGVQAKAQRDASARASKRADKAHDTCTPCAAAAKVEAYKRAAQDRVTPIRGRR